MLCSYLAHFQAQVRKIKKIHPEKKFLCLEKYNIKKFIIVSYIPGNAIPKEASYISENGNTRSKKFLLLQEKEAPEKFLILQKTETSKKFFIFQERYIQNPSITELSYISGKLYSEPQHNQNQKLIQNPGIVRTEAYSENCQTSMMETSTSTQFSGQARKIKIHPDKISCTLILKSFLYFLK